MEERIEKLIKYADSKDNLYLRDNLIILKKEIEIELIKCEIETIKRVSEQFSLIIKK